MAKIFITGINGFVGKHLLEQYRDNDVVGLVRPGTEKDVTGATLVEGDILDKSRIEEIISSERPDIIVHLAAFTSPSESIKVPEEALNNNINGQLNILEALRKHELLETKTLVISTSEIYGNVDPNQLPVNENTPLLPHTPYAVSKITQDFLGYQYAKSYGIKAVRVRPFNHIGPGQAPMFVVPAFARQIALIEKGQQEKVMRVGNLEAKKDFTDVRDVVRAYKLLIEKGEVGEVYNVGSGKSHSISEILEMLLSFSKEKIVVEKDPSLMRKNEMLDIYCDNSKLRSLTGWEPEIPLEETLRDALDYWRNIL